MSQAVYSLLKVAKLLGGQGGRVPPLTAKKLPKIVKKRKKSQKSGKKEEKSGKKGKNQEGSFTLPLLTGRASYATDYLTFCSIHSTVEWQ